MQLRELKLEITQECPLACVHCSTNSSRKQRNHLSEATVLRLLQEAADMGVEKIAFTGGEPLICDFLPHAISMTAAFGMTSVIYTSGIVDNQLNPLSASLASNLTSIGLSRFVFSLYSHRKEVHEEITRYGTYSRTKLAILNAVQSGGVVEIHFVAMKRNFRDLPGVVEFAVNAGLSRVSVLRFVPQGRGKNVAREDLDLSDMNELRDMVISLRATYPGVPVRTGSPFNMLLIGHIPCNAAQDVLVVNHRGEIFPCDAFKNVSFSGDSFGSVLTQPLREVWEQSSYLRRVRSVLDRHTGPECTTCSDFGGCKSGCLAQKVTRGGWQAVGEIDPHCLVQIASPSKSEDFEPVSA